MNKVQELQKGQKWHEVQIVQEVEDTMFAVIVGIAISLGIAGSAGGEDGLRSAECAVYGESTEGQVVQEVRDDIVAVGIGSARSLGIRGSAGYIRK